ncbi:MAG: YggT family protein [Candidatus Obscuribacterales bacterium]|nr:YggT family protein [Candidatus Obscuribacterales bacterium]
MSPSSIIIGFVQALQMVILLWCLLSWFPNIRWYEQPWRTLDNIVKPIMAPFRKIIPPLGGIDLSPMVAMLVIQFVAAGLVQVLPP